MYRVVLLAFILSASSFGDCQSSAKPSAPAAPLRSHIDCRATAQPELDRLLTAPCVDPNPRPVFAASTEIPQPLVPSRPRGLQIPKLWPDLKMEKIPTQWPNLKLLPITEKSPSPPATGSSKK
jgi:hypothetical protein